MRSGKCKCGHAGARHSRGCKRGSAGPVARCRPKWGFRVDFIRQCSELRQGEECDGHGTCASGKRHLSHSTLIHSACTVAVAANLARFYLDQLRVGHSIGKGIPPWFSHSAVSRISSTHAALLKTSPPPLLSGSMSGSFRFDDRRPVIRGNWRGITLIRPLYKLHIHYSQFGNSKIKIL